MPVISCLLPEKLCWRLNMYLDEKIYFFDNSPLSILHSQLSKPLHNPQLMRIHIQFFIEYALSIDRIDSYPA